MSVCVCLCVCVCVCVSVCVCPQYYAHMVANPDSLVPRFYGVYGVKQVHGRTVRFVVMANIFATDIQIHRKFDLKVGAVAKVISSSIHWLV